jgi:hypothetical protein
MERRYVRVLPVNLDTINHELDLIRLEEEPRFVCVFGEIDELRKTMLVTEDQVLIERA